MVFKPGEVNNPTGSTGKDKLFRKALMLELASRGETLPELRVIAREMLDAAQGIAPKRGRGKPPKNAPPPTPRYSREFATQTIIDRIDGKAHQPVSGVSDEPIVIALNYSGRAIADDAADAPKPNGKSLGKLSGGMIG